MVTLFYVIAEDANFNTSEVEMEFIHYTCGYWEFAKKKDINIFDAKYIFYRSCTPCETTKHGYRFKEDDEAFQRYKTRKATGFKSLRLNFWEINQATSKCQIDFWGKLAKKV